METSEAKIIAEGMAKAAEKSGEKIAKGMVKSAEMVLPRVLFGEILDQVRRLKLTAISSGE